MLIKSMSKSNKFQEIKFEKIEKSIEVNSKEVV